MADNAKDVEDALTELAEVNIEDLTSLFWDPMMQSVVRATIQDLDWKALWKQYKLVVQQRRIIVKPRPVLRSMR